MTRDRLSWTICLWIMVTALHLNSQQKKPNILVIFGDDIGYSNISAYSLGMLGYKTPNIDRLAKEGALFNDFYGQQSCTAGRSAFILGEHPFRTGLLTVGMPGSPHGIPDWAPTIADLLKTLGYATGQFGKNHLGDRDQHMPTNHGFDVFFGNLYHLNSEEEPETYYYPKDPEFHKLYGPRGVLDCKNVNGKSTCVDTGPLTQKRMETIDDDLYNRAAEFIDQAAKSKEPFFVWFNTTRMHVWTRLKPSSQGKTGIGLYADGMVEHDELVGELLKKIDDLGLRDNTIVIYTTDNGARNRHLAGRRIHTVSRRKRHYLGRRYARTMSGALAGCHTARNDLQQHHVARRLDADVASSRGRSRYCREA